MGKIMVVTEKVQSHWAANFPLVTTGNKSENPHYREKGVKLKFTKVLYHAERDRFKNTEKKTEEP